MADRIESPERGRSANTRGRCSYCGGTRCCAVLQACELPIDPQPLALAQRFAAGFRAWGEALHQAWSHGSAFPF